MIEIAPDNHIAELKLVPEEEHAMVDSFEEFNAYGVFSPSECMRWACRHEGRFYHGGVIEIADQEVANAPAWATHVYWLGV